MKKMKRSTILSLVLMLPVFALAACQRDRGVQADSSAYQPRPAPTSGEMKGDLAHVDPTGKTIGVRLENGVEQTFQCDEDTSVEGLPFEKQTTPGKSVKKTTANPDVLRLIGKEGSEVTVQWDTEDGAKIARDVEINELVMNKNRRRVKRH
jgi:hypothetical protein